MYLSIQRCKKACKENELWGHGVRGEAEGINGGGERRGLGREIVHLKPVYFLLTSVAQ